MKRVVNWVVRESSDEVKSRYLDVILAYDCHICLSCWRGWQWALPEDSSNWNFKCVWLVDHHQKTILLLLVSFSTVQLPCNCWTRTDTFKIVKLQTKSCGHQILANHIFLKQCPRQEPQHSLIGFKSSTEHTGLRQHVMGYRLPPQQLDGGWFMVDEVRATSRPKHPACWGRKWGIECHFHYLTRNQPIAIALKQIVGAWLPRRGVPIAFWFSNRRIPIGHVCGCFCQKSWC
jgi:hypothetical protein